MQRHKFPRDYDLFPEVLKRSNLYAAWRRVMENHGCAGVDGVAIPGFEEDLESNLAALALEMGQGSYRPAPLLKILVAKPSGEARALSVPSVRDRIAQAAVLNVVQPVFEKEFESCSFAYRQGRSVREAVYKVKEYYEDGYRWVLDADIDAFFDSVPHDLLLSKAAKIINEAEILRLIQLWVKAEVWDGKGLHCPLKGIPQGSVVSPALANLYLDEMDEELLRRGIRLVRYADDFLVLCRTREKAEQATLLTKAVLKKMELALDEADIVHFDDGFLFLGVVFCRSTVMVPFDRVKAPRRVLYMPPPLDMAAYRAGKLGEG